MGPTGDKREIARVDALNFIEAFEGTGDAAYLEEISSLRLRGGSKPKWPDPESFDEVKAAINALKKIAKSTKENLEALIYNPYDDKTEAMRPAIQEAFTLVRSFLAAAKYRQRILDFTDLEVQALKALQDPDVQRYYASRWKVFLIDEFQDTNPTQGKLLALLTKRATVTIVGDRKQSIYGFRRADPTVFAQWQSRIHADDESPMQSLAKAFAPIRA